MADRIQTFTTRIFINAEEAKNELEALQKKVDELGVKKEKAAKEGDWKTFNKAKHEIDSALKEMDKFGASAQRVNKTLNNLSDAGIKEINRTIRLINGELKSGAIKRGSEEWKFLNEQLARCKAELRDIRGESALTSSLWQRFTGFLNRNWGAITQIIAGLTQLTFTVRKSVQDFADMEEEMADVRKFTGLADEKVRDLNEDLKKMDTRTGRDQLNQLAGAAGRLGKQAKKDIMDFVEGADMINVALGEDLGDGAVEKIGKLAMAFGEDKRKGLKGAMLSTGSAVNELVQNSSAQAGYLVDFTARVAGFGKQLGLTQAQIMGFGTVMDENLLKDEMAATAFGNMLTKMQTDTEKFAKIAGKDVREFTDLLNKDANAAILALADNLKKADPQTMMKMLDDMGLDGSRAVGVLSTLADKIDDVRRHQQRATEAYEKATSIQDEFNIKNNTVQARLDKCRKAFKEMSIELGERLLPVVQYTITGASLLAKTLSVLSGFLMSNWKAIAVLTGYVTALTVVWNAHTMAVKASNAVETVSIALKKGHAFVVNTLKQAYVAWRIVIAAVTANHVKLNSAMVDMKRLQMTNVWTALITVVLTAAVAIYGAVTAWQKHREAVRNSMQEVKNLRAQQQLERDINKKVSESIAEQKTKVEQLTRIIRSNAYTVGERRSAIKALQQIVPDYHASISKEGQLYNENSEAIRQYIQDLQDAALAEAVYQKKVEINRKKMDLDFKENRIRGSLKAVQAYRDDNPEAMKPKQKAIAGAYSTSIEVQSDAMTESIRQQRIHEQRLGNVKSEKKVVEAEEQYIDKVLEKNKKANELLNKNATNATAATDSPTVTTPTTSYKSDAELKKEEEERRKREAEEKRRLKEAEDAAKAESDAAIAAKTHEYAMGKIAYRQYIQEMARLQTEGLQARRDVYQKGSAEYENLNRQVEERMFKGDQQVNRMKLDDLRRCMLQQQAAIEEQAAREMWSEEEKNMRLHTLEETYLADVVELYKEGSLERMQAEWELQDVEQRNKLERERYYQQQLQQVREQYLGMSNTRQMEIAMQGIDELHRRGLLKEKEYQIARAAIQAQYAGYQTTTERAEKTGSDMLAVARDAARQKIDGARGSDTPFIGDVMLYQTTMEKLKELYGNDKENHDAYLAAKRQATGDFCNDLAQKMQAAYNTVNQVMSAASSYFSAQQEYETAQVQKKYEKQIAAAGNNQKKVKKLQEKQQKEEAAIKTKYAKRAAAIQIAQAVATTAMNAIQAYGAVLQPANPASYVYASIAAAMAIAAGMLQIATIKKQQQAQEAGYYEGGFTGGRRYRKEAGVVHEGEFVANHQAVNNPNVLPFLNFLDQAQRNNTVGSLTAQDVSRQLATIPGGSPSGIVAPVVNVQNDNGELRDTLEDTRDVLDRLALQLEQGIGVDVPIDGENGLYRKLRRFEQLMKNKKI